MRNVLDCTQQLAVQLIGREADINTENIENSIGQNVSVTARPARFTGDVDVVVKKGGNLLLDEDLDEFLGAVRQEVLNTHEVEGWRVEAV